MALLKLAAHPLRGPPTALCWAFDRLYIATKTRRLFVLAAEGGPLSSVLLNSPATALAPLGDTLACGSRDGRVAVLTEAHGVRSCAPLDGAAVTCAAHDPVRGEALFGTAGKKVVVLGRDAIQRTSHFCQATPVAAVALGSDGTLAVVSESSQTVDLLPADGGAAREVRAVRGFPAAAVPLGSDRLLVGTAEGELQLYGLRPRRLLATLVLGAAVHALLSVGAAGVLVGLGSREVAQVRVHSTELLCVDRMAVVGIPVAFAAEETGRVAVALSREPRLGRWGRGGRPASGKNALWLLSVTEAAHEP